MPDPKANAAPAPTVEDVMAWIRHEVSQRQVLLPQSECDDPLAPRTHSKCLSPTHEAQWQRIRDNLNLAEQHALAGALVPELGRFRGVTRRVARFVARGLLYLGKVITNPQRKFNVAILGTLRDLHYTLRQWDQAQREQQEQERHTLADLRASLSKLEQDHAELKAQLLPPDGLISRMEAESGGREAEKRAA